LKETKVDYFIIAKQFIVNCGLKFYCKTILKNFPQFSHENKIEGISGIFRIQWNNLPFLVHLQLYNSSHDPMPPSRGPLKKLEIEKISKNKILNFPLTLTIPENSNQSLACAPLPAAFVHQFPAASHPQIPRDEKRNLRFPCIQWKREQNFVPVSTVYKGNANFVFRPCKFPEKFFTFSASKNPTIKIHVENENNTY
jgi:hypothetical protein